MVYSVFIISMDRDEQVNWKNLIGDTSLGTHVAGAVVAGIEDLAGFSFYDKYANMLTGAKSVALTGSMIESMSVKTYINRRENFEITEDHMEDKKAKDLLHTITIKGRLEPPDMLFAMGKKIAQKKDTSRIWKWANVHFNGAENDYFRKVVATVYSEADKQFRAFFLKKAFVESYEEIFDKNGEGTFNLVIKEAITGAAPQVGQDKEIEAKGPTFKVTKLSAAKDISKAAKTASKDAKTASKVIKSVVGENETTKKLDRYSKVVDSIDSGVDNVVKGMKPSDLGDEIDRRVKDFKKDALDQKEKGTSTTDKSSKVLPDGSTETTTTETATDGTVTTTVTTTKKDGSTSTKKSTKKS